MEPRGQASLRNLFENDVPLPFLNDSLRFLFGCYRQTHEDCRGMATEVAMDYRGHRRRALIEDGWLSIARRHGLTAGFHTNRRGSANYARIVSGRVVLTQSYVETPETLIRDADFRHTLARSNQPGLFGDDSPPLPDAPLYAILMHGAATGNRQPYFADVVFPAPDCRSYLGRIHLFDVCHALVRNLTDQPSVQEEVIPDEATPQLRDQDQRNS